MNKYIDAERLIHDLEERIYAYSEGYADGDNYRKDAIETLLKDVRYQCSLQQEQPEADLEKELKNLIKNSDNGCSSLDIARHFYGLRNRALEEAARHVYESWMGGTMDDVRRDMVTLGAVLNARKEDK